MIPAVTRFARTKTALVIASATAVVAGALLLSGRRAAVKIDGPDTADAGGITLTARPTSGAILRGTSETHVAITIRTPDSSEHARPPIALAVVLDTSGSMAGSKIEHAKAAARHLIDELGDGDRFALISFSTHAELLLPMTEATADAKQRATQAIGGLYADGGTNISDGLTIGSQAISGSADERVRRIVLISDGKPQQDGITDADALIAFSGEIATRGVSISTVGVGLDFDEHIMTGISVAARGNYYFVEDTAQLAGMFDHELDSLGRTVASYANVTIVPAPGVEILDAYGYRTTVSEGRTIIPISDLRAGETRKVVVRVRVTAGAAGSMELGNVTLTYAPQGDQMRKLSVVARTAITDEESVVAANLDKDTVRQVEQARTANALEEATAAYEKGDDAKARMILDQRAHEAQAAGAAVNDPALAEQVQTITTKTQAGFAAPPADDSGRRAVKATRLDAYEMAR
ncbi:MAG TPA: VWA domain-containing protein [Kofleriaceae bacterium]|jgi:Ca-activated chloride channel family protein|nr:VWA domain-containing protein [Kofleriaceae bacterium]